MEGARLSNQKQAEAESSKRGRPSSQNLGRKISRTKSVFEDFKLQQSQHLRPSVPAFLTHFRISPKKDLYFYTRIKVLFLYLFYLYKIRMLPKRVWVYFIMCSLFSVSNRVTGIQEYRGYKWKKAGPYWASIF